MPVGLLKLGAYYRSLNHDVVLVRGKQTMEQLGGFKPGAILVTSIFTYWSKYVWDTVKFYREEFPHSRIILDGIYATLHSDRKVFCNKLKDFNVECHVGLHADAEKFYPDSSLLKSDVDHHVTHAMRGCIRKCDFCGTWKIEPKRHDKKTEELVAIGKNKVIFFDNNFLANEHAKQILENLCGLKVNGRAVFFESQSGFDGPLLEKDAEFAGLLKNARFQY